MERHTAKKPESIAFSQMLILIIGVIVLAGMLWLPQTEGRAANLDLISIYSDPLIIFGYIASIPFFIGLYSAYKLVGFMRANKTASKAGLQALKYIKLASISLIGFIILGLLYIRFIAHGDDPAGPTMLGIWLTLGFGAVAALTSNLQKNLQKKS